MYGYNRVKMKKKKSHHIVLWLLGTLIDLQRFNVRV